MSALTDAQQEALNRAQQILGEHFDTSVIAVLAVIPAPGGGLNEASQVAHSGGRMAAIGLAVEATRALQSIKHYEKHGSDESGGLI